MLCIAFFPSPKSFLNLTEGGEILIRHGWVEGTKYKFHKLVEKEKVTLYM